MRMTNKENLMANTSNVKRGREWEKALAISFAALTQCTVVKVDAPVRVIRYNGHRGGKHTGEFTGYFEARGACDFEGGYRNRPVSIEAKRTKQRRWSFSAIQDHQKIRMEQTYLMGGISGVLLAWDHPQGTAAFFGVDWASIRDLIAQGKASVSPNELMDVCDDPDSGVYKLGQHPFKVGRSYLLGCDLEQFMDSFVGQKVEL